MKQKLEKENGNQIKALIKKRPEREIRKCDMCKQYPKKVTDQYYNYISAILKVKLIICTKCKKREMRE